MASKMPLSEFNLIDIFGHLIPGSLLLAGLLIPIDATIEFLDLPLIAGLTLVGIFAFVLGMAVSRIEGLSWFLSVRDTFRRLVGRVGLSGTFVYEYQPQHVFSEDLFQAQERGPQYIEDDPKYVPSKYFDYEILLLCREKFSLPENLSQSGYYLLWLGVLSYLETTPYTRAFRMQALYTFSSNMLIVSEILSVYYIILVVFKGLSRGFIFEGIPPLFPFRGMSILVVLLIVVIVFSVIFARSSILFMSQWHLYSKIEFYMNQKMDE